MGESGSVGCDEERRRSGALVIDRRTGSVTYGEEPVELTATEFRILELLNSHPGWVFPPSEIAEACLESGGSEDTIIVHISNLRAKLSRAGSGSAPIETVRGFGYRLVCDTPSDQPDTDEVPPSEALGDTLNANGSLADAAAAYLRALDLAKGDDHLPLARLHIKATQVAIGRRRLMEAMTHSCEAEKILRDRAEANQRLIDEVFIQRAWLTYNMGEFQDAYDQCIELLHKLEPSMTPQQRVALHGCASMSLLRLQRIVVTPQVLQHAWSMYSAWEESGDPTDAVYSEAVLGDVLLHSGNITGGERRLSSGLRMSEDLGEHALRPNILCSLGVAARRRGDVRLAERLGTQLTYEAAERDGGEIDGAGHGLRCWAAWRSGDLERAESEGQTALESLQLEPAFPQWWLALAPLIGVELSRGNLDEAISYARRMGDPSQQALPSEFDGALAQACSAWDAGNEADAREALSRAVLVGRSDGYT